MSRQTDWPKWLKKMKAIKNKKGVLKHPDLQNVKDTDIAKLEAYKAKLEANKGTRKTKSKPISEDEALRVLVSGKVEKERVRLEGKLEMELKQYQDELLKDLRKAMKLD